MVFGTLLTTCRPAREHTELEEELHTHAHIDYDRVAIIANPSVAALYEDALVYETGSAMTSTGALTAYSGAKTGRSPSDKRVVKEPGSEKDVWWGPVNKEMSPEVSLQYLLLRCLHTSETMFGRYSLLNIIDLIASMDVSEQSSPQTREQLCFQNII